MAARWHVHSVRRVLSSWTPASRCTTPLVSRTYGDAVLMQLAICAKSQTVISAVAAAVACAVGEDDEVFLHPDSAREQVLSYDQCSVSIKSCGDAKVVK